MRKRVPVDIQFLYEGIFNEPVLKEDPDYVGSLSCSWTDNDARAFLYDPNNGIFAITDRQHYFIYPAILGFIPTEDGDGEETFEPIEPLFYNGKNGGIEISYRSDEDETIDVTVYGLNASSNEELRSKLKSIAETYMNNVDVRHRNSWVNVAILGRCWRHENVVSFWNELNVCVRHMKGLINCLKNFAGVDVETAMFETIDLEDDLMPFDEFVHGDNEGEKMTPEEYKEKLAKQHLDPQAKKDLTGDEYRERHGKKQCRGFDCAAKANYYARQSDCVEKRGNLLKENPEYMAIPNPKNPEYGNIELEYGMSSARSFVYFIEHDLYIEGEVNDAYHSDIVHAIVLGIRDGDKLEWAGYNFKIKGRVESFDKLKEEKLKMGTSFTNFSDREDPRMFGFLGRSWIPFNAMSFWCHQGWHPKLLESGVIEKVVDFVGLDKNEPLYVGYGNTEKALLIGGKKTKEDEMSPEEYKALQAKQHLDPEAKKKLTGDEYKTLAAKKRSMGFDYPAQANYYGRQSDGVIKLGQLLESPDEVYLVPDKETPDLEAATKGAYPFIYEPHDSLMFIPAKRGDRTFTVHSEMFETLHEVKIRLENEAMEIEDAYKAFVDGSIWNKKCYVDRAKKLIYAESHRVDDPFIIQYHGSDKALVDYLFNTMQIWENNRGMEDVRESDLGIQGRVWERHNVLAIWNPTHEMVEFKSSGVMDKIISILGLDAKTLRVSPGDTVEVVDYASLEGGDIKKMTDAEYRELLKKQHLDADAKRKLADLDGEQSYSKKQLGGYDYMAQRNFYSRQSDGIISLKSLIG